MKNCACHAAALCEKYQGELCVIVSAVCFGLMPLLTKIVAAHGGDACMAALGRFFFGGLLLLPLLSRQNGAALRIPASRFREILPLSVLYALTPILLFTSYDYIGSGLATTLHFTFPVAVIALSAVLLGALPDRRQLFCALLCTVGVSQLSSGGDASAVGLWLSVASGGTYALYIVLLGRSSLRSLPALATAFWLSLLASLEIAVFAALTGKLRFSLDGTGWAAMLALALVATVLGLVLFQKGLFRCGAVRASLLSTFEPLTSVWIGWLVFYEAITFSHLVGILCVLVSGVLLVLPVFPRGFSAVRGER